LHGRAEALDYKRGRDMALRGLLWLLAKIGDRGALATVAPVIYIASSHFLVSAGGLKTK
jgi:hypothetical protein